jgi:YD repeat-containing protein
VQKDNGDGTSTTGMSVSGAILFDAFGRVAQQGQPTFSASTSASLFVTPGAPVHATLFSYDILDRTTSVQTPDGALTTTTYTLDSLGGTTRLATFVKDPNVNAGGGLPGTVHESFRGVRDTVLAVKETNRLNGSTPTTLLRQYAYNPLDELVQVTDAKGNLSSATYDPVGRMVALNSPDMGLTTQTSCPGMGSTRLLFRSPTSWTTRVPSPSAPSPAPGRAALQELVSAVARPQTPETLVRRVRGGALLSSWTP